MDKSNLWQVGVLVRNAIAAFLIFFALVQGITWINWRQVNWEVVLPTGLGIASSYLMWQIQNYRESREHSREIAAQLRIEQDTKLTQRQEHNLALIQELQGNLDATAIAVDSSEKELKHLKGVSTEILDRLSKLEKDLQTHFDKWAHKGAEEEIQAIQRAVYKIEAKLDGLTGSKEIERRIDTVSQSVHLVHSQIERLRHIVGKLPASIEHGEKEESSF